MTDVITSDHIASVSLSDADADPEGFAQELGKSFVEYGFAIVRDHGIAQELIDRADKLSKQFFALPDESAAQPIPEFIERFTDCVNDDLNMPRALAVAWELLRGDARDPAQAKATLKQFDRVFGLALAQWKPEEASIPDAVKALADARLAARKGKDWAEADRLRKEIAVAGFEVEDRADGYTVKPVEKK